MIRSDNGLLAGLATAVVVLFLAGCGGGGGDETVPVAAPTIAAQPQSVTVTAGQTASFSVMANGTAPLAYQWRRNGTNIAGATAASYTTPPTVAGDNGAQFSVVVSNAAGAATSGAATLTVSVASGPTREQLLSAAQAFPRMPRETADLLPFTGPGGTFASGSPANDLEWTLLNTDYMEGETAGFDTFMPVNPADPFPGSNTVKIVLAVSSLTLDQAFGAARGDRVILGTAEIAQPFFLRGSDGLDNDYAVIQNFDFVNGFIQLRGQSTDYALAYCTIADGCASEGWFLFFTKDFGSTGQVDLIAFVQPCWDTIDISANPPTNTPLCNADRTLSLSNPGQFRYAQPLTRTAAVPNGVVQFGSAGKEINSGITADQAGNIYLFGSGDGNLDGGSDPNNEMYVAKIAPDGTRLWVTELGSTNGALLFAAVTDSTYLYAAGRTHGSLPGFQSGGGWDGVLVKMRLDNGQIVATHQWGLSGLDGYGTIALDDAGNLYVSGQGAPQGAPQGDNMFLVAKHSAATLQNIWRVLDPVTPTSTGVAEAWGGITYVPSPTAPGQGKLVVGGWFLGRAADAFIALYGNLDQALPVRLATQVVSSLGSPGPSQATKADWVFDNVADKDGNIYAVGYTTGNLAGAHLGEGDMFVVKFDPNLANPVYAQWGTNKTDMFRKMAVDDQGNLYAVGYTYGDYSTPQYQGRNADRTFSTGDIVVQKFDRNLNRLQALQFGTPGEDRASVFIRGSTVYVGGMTEGSLVGPNLGTFDAFALSLSAGDLSIRP